MQQVYSLALWYWGSLVSNGQALPNMFIAGTIPEAMVICIPIAVVLWIIGIVLLLGLPDFYRQAPWMILFPGAAISLAVFAFNLFGDSLRDYLDPRFKT